METYTTFKIIIKIYFNIKFSIRATLVCEIANFDATVETNKVITRKARQFSATVNILFTRAHMYIRQR